MQRMLRGYLYSRRLPVLPYTPGITTVKSLRGPVFRRIFKITVLHQFGIKSAISSIIDVFKENPHQFVTDRLGFFRTDCQLQGYRSQPGKTLAILFRPFIVQLVSVSPVVHELQQSVHFLPGHFLHISLFYYTVHNRFLAGFTSPDSSSFSRRLQVIRLRIPFHQVGRSGLSPLLSAFVQLPGAMPHAFCIPRQMRIQHTLLGSPGSVIASHIPISIADTEPTVGIRAPRQFQPAAPRIFHGGIREQVD